MEIPYTVTARPDTGLWNAKIGIWLFLASEVMLFGGLFSSYIFLRVGADYPWPFHELHVWPGLTNTFVLIASSVTVLMALDSLKLRKYGAYKMYMVLTILCALIFMGLKSFEYYGKFTHWGVKLKDNSFVDGHEPHDHVAFGKVATVTLNLEHAEAEWLKEVKGAAPKFKDASGKSVELTAGLVDDLRSQWHKDWQTAEGAVLEVNDKIRDIKDSAEQHGIDESALKALEAKLADAKKARDAVTSSVKLTVDGAPILVEATRGHLRHWTKKELVYRDGTKLDGELENDHLDFHAVTGWDVRAVKGLDENINAADNALIWKYLGEDKRQAFLKQKKEAIDAWVSKYSSKHKNVPNVEEVAIAAALKDPDFLREGFRQREDDHSTAHFVTPVANEDIKFYSNYTPRMNPYYAIYFMMTGLHGLHVIGGASVLAYFLCFGRKMYEKDPEHLCNRVEVGGLFWHFVDLVWIFLFPVFYLL